MKAPDKLFLHDNRVARPSWHHGRVAEGDVEYIRKETLLEWINEARAIPHENAIARDLAFQEVVNYLNGM